MWEFWFKIKKEALHIHGNSIWLFAFCPQLSIKIALFLKIQKVLNLVILCHILYLINECFSWWTDSVLPVDVWTEWLGALLSCLDCLGTQWFCGAITANLWELMVSLPLYSFVPCPPHLPIRANISVLIYTFSGPMMRLFYYMYFFLTGGSKSVWNKEYKKKFICDNIEQVWSMLSCREKGMLHLYY